MNNYMKNKKKWLVAFISIALFFGIFKIIKLIISSPCSPAAVHSLTIDYVTQKNNSNCGPACIEMIFKFNSIATLDQCQIVQMLDNIDTAFSLRPGCNSPCNPNCNDSSNCGVRFSPNQIIRILNYQLPSLPFRNTSTSDTNRIKRIVEDNFALANPQPIIAYGNRQFTCVSGGSNHFVLITGYETDGKCNFYINVFDPYGVNSANDCEQCIYKIPLNSALFTIKSLIHI
jgi:Peptidase_C39 like family